MLQRISLGAQDFEYIRNNRCFYVDKTCFIRETVANALTQIKEKDYDAELTARGIPREQIRHYGFAFEGKTVLIG